MTTKLYVDDLSAVGLSTDYLYAKDSNIKTDVKVDPVDNHGEKIATIIVNGVSTEISAKQIDVDDSFSFQSTNPIQNAIISKKVFEDYTSFEVYPTETVISGKNSLEAELAAHPEKATDPDFLALSARSWSGNPDIQYIEGIPVQTKAAFEIYTTVDHENSDIVIDWGDGTPLYYVKDQEEIQLSDIAFDDQVKFSIQDMTSGKAVRRETNFIKSTDVDKERCAYNAETNTLLSAVLNLTTALTCANNVINIPAGSQLSVTNDNEDSTYISRLDWIQNGEAHSIRGIFLDYRDISNQNGVLHYRDRDVCVCHDYKTEGKYEVKIYGKYYYLVRAGIYYGLNVVNGSAANALISDAFGLKYKLASNIRNVSSMCSKCKRIQYVRIHSSLVDNIANFAGMFSTCENLVTFEGDSQNTFGSRRPATFHQVFDGCKNLKTITNLYVPVDVRYSGHNDYFNTFAGCTSLEADVLTLLPWHGFFGVNVAMNGTFTNCSKITCSDYKMLADMLWNSATKFTKTSKTFKGCTSLDLTKIPRSWGGTASDDIIESIDVLKTKVTVLQNGLKSLEGIIDPMYDGNILVNALGEKAYTPATELTGSTYSFRQQYPDGFELKEVRKLAQSITSISAGSFENCKSMTEVKGTVFNNIQDIGMSAFINTNLTAVDLPNVSVIPEYAFTRGTKPYATANTIEHLNLPEATEIKARAFEFALAVENLNNDCMPNVSAIADYGIHDNNIKHIDLPNVKTLGTQAFYQSHVLEDVRLENAEKIGSRAFALCPNLTTVYLPKVKQFAGTPFYDSPKVEIDFGTEMTEVPIASNTDMFHGCTGVKCYIPDSDDLEEKWKNAKVWKDMIENGTVVLIRNKQ